MIRSLLVFAAAFAVVFIVGGVGVYVLVERTRKEHRLQDLRDRATHGNERPVVRTLASRFPDVPIPEGVPYVGPDGVDEDGYPRHAADAEGLLALLHAGEHEKLDVAYDAYLTAYRENHKAEYVLLDAIMNVAIPEVALGHDLDAWIAAKPDSFAPYAVRGFWHIEIAHTLRGTAVNRETSAEKREAMHREVELAWSDLDRAARLSSNAAPVLHARFRASRLVGAETRFTDAFTRAMQDCPTCIAWRTSALAFLQPKWGGSKRSMLALERDALSRVAANSRLSKLEGRAAYLLAASAMEERPFPEQVALIRRHFGDSTYWGHELLRAELLMRVPDYPALLVSARRILEQRPGDPQGRLYEFLGLWGTDHDLFDVCEAAMHVGRLLPDERRLREFVNRSGPRLPLQAYAKLAVGDIRSAERYMAFAEALAPTSQAFRDFGPRFAADVARAPAINAAVADNPYDFQAVLAFDHFYAHAGQFWAVAEKWTKYLERNPNDANALAERCGTHVGGQKLEEALHDCEAACRLGNQTGCSGVASLRARYRNLR